MYTTKPKKTLANNSSPLFAFFAFPPLGLVRSLEVAARPKIKQKRFTLNMFVFYLAALVLATSLADESVNATEASDDGFFNNVDMANLLLDYNADWGPNKTVTVTLSTYVIHASWSNQKLKATLYFRQRWRDHRLAFVGSKDIQISSRFEIWEPDTFLTTSLKTSKSGDRFRRLSPDGTVFKSVKMTATVPCPTTVEHLWANDGVVDCDIAIESYGFSGVSLIRYQWQDQDAVKFSENSSIKGTNSSTDVVTLSFGTEYPRATASIKLQTTLTKQVLEHITLKKTDL